jgi:hypothetical protein
VVPKSISFRSAQKIISAAAAQRLKKMSVGTNAKEFNDEELCLRLAHV